MSPRRIQADRNSVAAAIIAALASASIVVAAFGPQLHDSLGRLPLDVTDPTWRIVSSEAQTLDYDKVGELLAGSLSDDAAADAGTNTEAEAATDSADSAEAGESAVGTTDGADAAEADTATLTVEDLLSDQQVTQQSHLRVTSPSGGDSATVDIARTITREDGTLVTASILRTTLDRTTAAAVPGERSVVQSQLGSAGSEVELVGQVIGFPVGTEQRSYDYWVPELRAARPATFVGTEEIDGATLYRFEQQIERTNLATSYEDELNRFSVPNEIVAQAGAPVDESADSTALYRFVEGERSFLVDPVTGVILDQTVQINEFYGTDQGQEVLPVIAYTGAFDEETQQAQRTLADHMKGSDAALGTPWQIALYIIGAIGWIVAIVLVARRWRRA